MFKIPDGTANIKEVDRGVKNNLRGNGWRIRMIEEISSHHSSRLLSSPVQL